jgi:Ser/Thr protein kinase RdoA (MazF antagonist)
VTEVPWEKDGGLRYAKAALAAYDLPAGLEPKLICLSENATFLIEGDEPVGVLRVYRPHYQTDAAKRSELAWIEELRSSGVVSTPGLVRTRTGDLLNRVSCDGDERDTVLFEYVAGRELGDEQMDTYTAVGSIAARLHLQVQQWKQPAGFERMVWGLEEILGPQAHWGNWRQGPALDARGMVLLEDAERKVRERLAHYPLDEKNSGLVHGDLRAANILSEADGTLWVIDFDDSGFSWFLWDLCSTTTFMEHTPALPDIVNAWLDGYTQVRPLTDRDLSVISDLVFLRRLHILAWLGSHPESDLARDMGGSFTAATLDVTRAYLDGRFLPRVSTLG